VKHFFNSLIIINIIVLLTGVLYGKSVNEVIEVTGVDLKSVYRRLENAGFDPGEYDPNDLAPLAEAIARFQKIAKLETNGILDSYTWQKLQQLYDPMLNSSARDIPESHLRDGCEAEIFLKPNNARNLVTESGKLLKPLDLSSVSPEKFPVKPQSTVFAVEHSECPAISGHWVILYEGVATGIQGDHVAVRVEKRLGYRLRPQQQGIDSNNWWCIPPRRHCYSVVKFNDWNGPYTKNQVVSFPQERVYNAKLTIINSMTHFLGRTCK